MINKEDVLKIAKLARLELTDQEVEKMQKDLSSILDYFEMLKKAPKLAKKSSNLAHGNMSDGNSTRKDEAMNKNTTLAQDLVQAAPEKKDGYIQVKQVLS